VASTCLEQDHSACCYLRVPRRSALIRVRTFLYYIADRWRQAPGGHAPVRSSLSAKSRRGARNSSQAGNALAERFRGTTPIGPIPSQPRDFRSHPSDMSGFIAAATEARGRSRRTGRRARAKKRAGTQCRLLAVVMNGTIRNPSRPPPRDSMARRRPPPTGAKGGRDGRSVAESRLLDRQPTTVLHHSQK
jgi:hypothetical protein